MQDFIDQLKQAVGAAPTSGPGALIAAVLLAILRILGDNKLRKLWRITIELPTVGILVIVSNNVLAGLGLDPEWALFSAAMIGHLGTNWVRDTARRFTDMILEKYDGRFK